MATSTGRELGFGSRLLLGSIAGIAGTAAMTASMNRLHRRLPPGERYPLPPREITERVLGGYSEESIKDRTTAAHFGFGAAMGALTAVLSPGARPLPGAVAGVAIWAASYFGWAPALGILRQADTHPLRRNALMIASHLVWGSVTAATLRDLLLARTTMLEDGPLADSPEVKPAPVPSRHKAA